MRTIFAVAVVASLSAAVTNALKCGAGTHIDAASDTCVITTNSNQRNARAGNGGPSIDTEDGNVLISVDGDGKQVGYRIGDKTIFFDDMADELRGYASGAIGAINLGYKVGVVDGGSNAVLDYLKDDLSERVNTIKTKQESVDEKVAAISGDVTSKLNAQNVKAAADLKSASDALTNAVNTKLKQQTDATTASTAKLTTDVAAVSKDVAAVTKTVTDMVKVMEKTAECASKGLSFNPIATTCCTADEIFGVTEKKCIDDLLGTEKKPAKSCMAIFKKHKYGKSKNGMFYLDVGTTISAYCKFDGDYPGATLVARRPGNVGGEQSRTGRVRYPCKGGETNAGQSCKLSDAEINVLKGTSTATDPYVSLSYKNRNPSRPACRSFAHKRCEWNMVSASTGCQNSVVRNSGQYCSRGQKHNSYRGLDGYHCPNLNYNSNNKFRAGDGGVQSPGNPFNIWEHSGGSHYCGGWDTTWRYIELWIH